MKKLANAFVEAVERAIAPVPQVRNFQHVSLGNKPAPVEFVPDVEVVGNPAVRRFHDRNSGDSAGGAAAAMPALKKIGVVGTRPALPEREDINASEDEGNRTDAETEGPGCEGFYRFFAA
jgi:hypothetical protein